MQLDDDIPGDARWLATLRRLWFDMDDKNLFLIAAGVAFYGILAVFPAIAAVIALWGMVADPAAVAVELERYRGLLPDDVYDLFNQQITQLARADEQALGWASVISIFLAIWTARAGVAALMKGLNAIYGRPNRAGLAHYARALMLTGALIGVALVALASVVVAPIVMQVVPLGAFNETVLELARWAIAISVLLAGFSLIYRIGPNRAPDTHRRWVTAGAVFATLCWSAASAGFSIYLSNFGNYNEVYGSIGAVIALLMWLFISAFLVLLGGALNAHLERRAARDAGRGPT